jgi:hypothetical protein
MKSGIKIKNFWRKKPPPSPGLPGKAESILRHERSVAGFTAVEVLGEYQISVWEILIPPLFFFNFLRNRKSKELFVKNFLFTKMLALEGAFQMAERGEEKAAALSRIEERTRAILDLQNRGFYSPAIRDKQLAEVGLLLDHFCLLLKADGQSHEEMVRNAYAAEKQYLKFLERLARAEKEVNAEALKTMGGADAEVQTTLIMEKAAQKIRREMAEKMFSPPARK